MILLTIDQRCPLLLFVHIEMRGSHFVSHEKHLLLIVSFLGRITRRRRRLRRTRRSRRLAKPRKLGGVLSEPHRGGGRIIKDDDSDDDARGEGQARSAAATRPPLAALRRLILPRRRGGGGGLQQARGRRGLRGEGGAALSRGASGRRRALMDATRHGRSRSAPPPWQCLLQLAALPI